jgi:tetratricopeptide (TPR) repeat protein
MKVINNRPFSFLTFALNFHFNQFDVFGYHLVNNLIHLLSGICVYWFVILIFSTPVLNKEEIKKYSKEIALLTALIFVAHPVQTEAVTYIVQRMASMASFFYILSLCLYVKGRLRHVSNKIDYKVILFYSGTALSFLLAVMSKEIAFTLPVALILFEVFFIRDENKKLYSKYIFTAALIIIISASIKIITSGIPRETSGISRIHYLLTEFNVIATYLRLFILPINQVVFYTFQVSKSIFELSTLLSFFLLTGILVGSILLFKKYRILSFCILWFFLTLSIESGIFPIRDVIFEHRMYLLMFGLALFLVTLIYYAFSSRYRKQIIYILSIIIILFAYTAYARNSVWKTEISLWTDNIVKTPDNPRAYYSRGHVYSLTGPAYKAVIDYSKSIELDSTNALVYNDRSVAYNQLGKYDLAISDLNKAITLMPDMDAAFVNRGITYTSLKQYNNALADYDKAISLNTANPESYLGRGNIYATLGQYNQAIYNFSLAIEHNPEFVEAFINRGSTFNMSGAYLNAIEDFTHALELNPFMPEVYKDRASAYFQMKDYSKAINDYSIVLKYYPKDSQIFFYRALCYYCDEQPVMAWYDIQSAIHLGYPVSQEQLNKFKEKLNKN